MVAVGTVIEGKVVVEELTLPEGASVTILARGAEDTVRLSPHEEAELLAALEEAELDEGIPAEVLLEKLRRFG